MLLGCGRENIHGALEGVGDGGKVHLDGSFGETSPSHSPEAVTSFPCSEDFFDPAQHTMDRLVPLVKPCLSFFFGARPNAGGDDSGNAAFGQYSIAK